LIHHFKGRDSGLFAKLAELHERIIIGHWAFASVILVLAPIVLVSSQARPRFHSYHGDFSRALKDAL